MSGWALGGQSLPCSFLPHQFPPVLVHSFGKLRDQDELEPPVIKAPFYGAECRFFGKLTVVF